MKCLPGSSMPTSALRCKGSPESSLGQALVEVSFDLPNDQCRRS
jgi:hypothetical protein